MSMQCLLCASDSVFYLNATLLKRKVDYFKCSHCDLIFLQPTHRLPVQEERERYSEHQNDITDPRYREFVQPLVTEILRYTESNQEGLDFGAGPGPVILQMLKESGYSSVRMYDPVFCPDEENLKSSHDFIFANEVIEHLHAPKTTFQLLKEILKPGGHLFCGTRLWSGGAKEFENWFYRRDPTHVCFYSSRTAEVIAEIFQLKLKHCEGSIIIFSN